MACRPAPDSFARTVTNLTTCVRGATVVFGLGSATLEVWRPREAQATWVFTLLAVSEVTGRTRRLHTVSVVPGEGLRLDVVSGDGKVTLAEGFRGTDAAIGFALESATGSVWAMDVQSDPDPVAV